MVNQYVDKKTGYIFDIDGIATETDDELRISCGDLDLDVALIQLPNAGRVWRDAEMRAGSVRTSSQKEGISFDLDPSTVAFYWRHGDVKHQLTMASNGRRWAKFQTLGKEVKE